MLCPCGIGPFISCSARNGTEIRFSSPFSYIPIQRSARLARKHVHFACRLPRLGHKNHTLPSCNSFPKEKGEVKTVSRPSIAVPFHPPRTKVEDIPLRYFVFGALAAAATSYLITFIATLPPVRWAVNRFIWWNRTDGNEERPSDRSSNSLQQLDGDLVVPGESVEWVNMCWRKAWRVYQRGLERWLASLLQPVFDNLVADKMVPAFVQRLRIAEFTLDHEAPYFTNMRRRNSRKDSDLTGVVDVRYTGGARMLLLIECGTGKARIKVPVLVSDLDLECKMWIKVRLAPMCPWIGTLSLAFVTAPTIKVQLAPYNRIRLMRMPILQPFLTRLLTVDLPGLMTLPQRLEINIPPAVTAVAEAAVGRDAVMRAVASAVLQADALEHALVSALPLGPQGAAGGISLPDEFQGELQVTLVGGRGLPVWGFPWQSNPYCRLTLGSQAVRSKRDKETSTPSAHRSPVWNQEFQFLVEDPTTQNLEIWIRDSHITGRPDVGKASLSLSSLPEEGTLDSWLPVYVHDQGAAEGAVRVVVAYRKFLDDEHDSGYREAAAYKAETAAVVALDASSKEASITDVKSAADASSRAAVAASAAAAAIAVTKAAAARAAARLARRDERAEQFDDMTRAMEKLTDEVIELSGAGETTGGVGLEASEAAAKTVENAERLAARAVASGDVAEANRVLQDAAIALERTAASLEQQQQKQQQQVAPEEAVVVVEEPINKEAKAKAALVAALAAANVAAEEAAVIVEGKASDNGSGYVDIEEEEEEEEEDRSTEQSDRQGIGTQSLWSQMSRLLLGPPPSRQGRPEDVAEDADGSAAGLVSGGGEGEEEGKKNGPVGDIIISPDIPIEEIAAEVQRSWKMRERHVEILVQKALEGRQRERENMWIVITAVMATSSAVLLAIVLYRLMHSS